MALETYVSIVYETEYGTAPDEIVGEVSPITITEREIPILSYSGFNHVGWIYNGNLVKIGDTIYSDSAETTVTFVAVWEKIYTYVDESSGAYKPRLQNNNVDLEKIFDMINELPSFKDTSDATATASDILSGKTAYANDGKITGTMTDRSIIGQNDVIGYSSSYPNTPTSISVDDTLYMNTNTDGVKRILVKVPPGYYKDGTSYIGASAEKLGTTTEDKVLAGETFSSTAGRSIEGTMVNNGAVAPAALAAGGSYTIPAGYHDGTGKVTTQTLASQTDGTATAAQILEGKTAYVDGSKVTGTMTDRSVVGQNDVIGYTANYPTTRFIPSYNDYLNIVTNTDGVKRIAVRAPTGSYVANAYIGASASLLGNATAADVLAGKTFTSNSGLKLTGTLAKGFTTIDVGNCYGSNILGGSHSATVTSQTDNSATIRIDVNGYGSITLDLDLS